MGEYRPFFTTDVYGNTLVGDIGDTNDERDAFERLFFQYQVDQCGPGLGPHFFPL